MPTTNTAIRNNPLSNTRPKAFFLVVNIWIFELDEFFARLGDVLLVIVILFRFISVSTIIIHNYISRVSYIRDRYSFSLFCKSNVKYTQ